MALTASLLALGAPALRAAPSEATFNYLRSDNGGDGFVALRQLDDVDQGLNITQMDASGGNVHALFDTANDEPGRVFYRRSTDGGRSFGDSMRLDVVNDERVPDEVQSTEADLHAEGNTVHVAWTGNPVDVDGAADPCCEDPSRDDIFYTRSSNGGETFPVPLNLTAAPGTTTGTPTWQETATSSPSSTRARSRSTRTATSSPTTRSGATRSSSG